MGKWKRYIPEGMNDIIFNECALKTNIETNLKKLYKYNGFSEVITPTLEFYDVFNCENQPIEQEKMYKLFDNQGRIMVLRPDVTTPIARIVATKVNKKNYPLKLCYTSNVFRINENFNGKTSEITQSGIEIIGVKNLRADAEVIITAIRALLSLGLKNFKIELAQAEFFKAIIEEISFESEEEIEKLRLLIENKSFTGLNSFLNNKQESVNNKSIKILEELPRLFGGIEILEEAKKLTDNEKALKALDSIYEVYKIIDKIGLSSYISIDLGMIQHINYYTGIIFKGYVDDVGDYILSGGRYDNLIQQFGTNLSATGFAINVDNIMIAFNNQQAVNIEKYEKMIIVYNHEYVKYAYELLDNIQKKSIVCELSLYEDIESSLEYARNNDVDKVIEILNEKQLKVYNVTENENSMIDIENFIL